VLTGSFDGTTFTVTAPARTLALHDPAVEPEATDFFATPCPAPAGGWKVLDPATTDEQSMQQVFARASQLDGYAASWLDQSRNPSTDEGDQNDPTLVTVNVQVTGDLDAAEAELRTVWGGALCVSPATYTEKELQAIQRQLQQVPGLLTSDTQGGVVSAEVVHDDGSIQAWADEVYGSDRVVVRSALKPA
jgi:hypothetical protein